MLHHGIKNIFVLFCSRFYVLCDFIAKILHLGIKNKWICFVLLSILRIFATKIKNYYDETNRNLSHFYLCTYVFILYGCRRW